MQEMKMRLASADTGRKRHWIMNTKRFSQTNQRETFSLVGFNQKPKKRQNRKTIFAIFSIDNCNVRKYTRVQQLESCLKISQIMTATNVRRGATKNAE